MFPSPSLPPPPKEVCATTWRSQGTKSLYDAHAPSVNPLEDHLGSTFLPLFIAKKMMLPMQSKPTTAPMAMPAMAPPDRPSLSSSEELEAVSDPTCEGGCLQSAKVHRQDAQQGQGRSGGGGRQGAR